MPQLDGLRFLAIAGVMIQHNWRPGPMPWIFGRLDYAETGVRLFFVLSGFLITGILLRGRAAATVAATSRLSTLRNFYVRRFLRIFPVYYATLLAVVLLDISPARQIWPWLVTYTTNIYIWHRVAWIGHLGHLWTLAVEEQFYIVWPWLVLFLPRRLLRPILGCLIVLAQHGYE